MSIIDHIGILVSDYEKSRDFYLNVLAPLGIGMVQELNFPGVTACGMGRDTGQFWLTKAENGPISQVHVAFSVDKPEDVDAFHKAALAAGATDNGGPGLREHYHPNYYGAFVLDPDGHNVEAVYHGGAPS